MNKIVITLVVLVLIGLGGFAYVQQKNKNATYGNTSPSAQTDTPATGGTTATSSTGTKVVTFTMTEIAKHNSASSCYTTIRGSVYNLTSWISAHPGGEGAILGLCGKDGTTDFMNQHDGQGKPEKTLATFKIGILAQ